MWIFTYKDSDTNYKKWLQPNNIYHLGRSSENVESSNFIHFNQIYISKEHLQIEIKSIPKDSIYDHELKTPLLIKIQSRAITRINNEKVKLKKDQDPFVIDYSHENLIHITFKEERAIDINIEWVPLNVCRYTKQIMVAGHLDFNPLTDELLKLFDSGIDLRISNSPFVATHYLTLSDHESYGLKVSLLRGIPIVNTDWTDYIRENKDKFEAWFLNLNPIRFLPFSKGDSLYLMPNKKRNTLFNGSLFVLFDESREKLSRWIACVGGTTLKLDLSKYYVNNSIDQGLISLIRNKVKELDCSNCFIMEVHDTQIENFSQEKEALADFVKVYDSSCVSEIMLFESIVSLSVKKLQGLNLEKELKRESPVTEIGSSEPQRKRRKFKKVGITDFFDFKPPIKCELPIQNEHTQANEKEEKIINKDDITQTSEPQKVLASVHQVIPLEKSIVAKPLNVPLDKNEEPLNTSIKRLNDNSLEEEPSYKKMKKEPKIGKFIPQISLVDAIKSTKEKAAENVREELGIDEENIYNHISKNLNNLAIVETIDISIKKRKPVSNELRIDAFKDRKNFKKFTKNKLIKSDKNTYIEMNPVHVGNGEENIVIEYESKDKDTSEKEFKLNNDFGGTMGDINGYKPHSSIPENDVEDIDSFKFVKSKQLRESTLFVPEDDSQKEDKVSYSVLHSSIVSDHQTTPEVNNVELGNGDNNNNDDNYDDDEDDDDDDDEQPKFAFSR